jgi:hypothetical protein
MFEIPVRTVQKCDGGFFFSFSLPEGFQIALVEAWKKQNAMESLFFFACWVGYL